MVTQVEGSLERLRVREQGREGIYVRSLCRQVWAAHASHTLRRGFLAIGFTPGLPTVEVSPEVIFLVFLPPLLNSEAFSFSPLDLRARLHSITLLAVGLENLPLLPLFTHVPRAYVPGSPEAAVERSRKPRSPIPKGGTM